MSENLVIICCVVSWLLGAYFGWRIRGMGRMKDMPQREDENILGYVRRLESENTSLTAEVEELRERCQALSAHAEALRSSTPESDKPAPDQADTPSTP